MKKLLVTSNFFISYNVFYPVLPKKIHVKPPTIIKMLCYLHILIVLWCTEVKTDTQSDTDTQKDTCRSLTISDDHIILNCSNSDVLEKAMSFDSAKVTILDLTHCGLERMPSFLSPESFSNIVHLNLSSNGIHEYLEHLHKFSKLKTLNLNFNMLGSAFMPVCGSGLITMSAENNKIEKVELAPSCVRLKELYLQDNNIKNFVIDLLISQNHEKYEYDLQTLNLSRNKLTQIKVEHFAALKSMESLYLSNNGITNIEEDTFRHMKFLEKVDLSHNLLESIPPKLFSDNEYLKYLDLSGNRLQTIPTQLPILDWLDVSFNNITTITEEYNIILYPVRVFLIGGNPFKCTCEMLWLKELFNVRKYLLQYLKDVDSSKFFPVCDRPVEYQGILWDKLEDTVFECTGALDQVVKETNEKVASVLNDGEILKATDIKHNSISLKWNIISTVKVDKVEITYHPFGKKKDLKVIKLSSKTRYMIQNLTENTPYIICLSVKLETQFTDCIEVTTKDKPLTGLLHIMFSVYSFVKTYHTLVALTVGLCTIIYIVKFLSSPTEETIKTE